MPFDEYLEQSTSRMPPGGVYFTLNELGMIAAEGGYSSAWVQTKLRLGNATDAGSGGAACGGGAAAAAAADVSLYFLYRSNAYICVCLHPFLLPII